jgi:hypothetical protein
LAEAKRGQKRRQHLGRAVLYHPLRVPSPRLSYALARAAVDFARERGARALEGYSMIPERGKDVAWGELNVGHVSIFTAAGFAEVSRPTLRRAVMRIDF